MMYACIPEDRRMDAVRIHKYGRVEDLITDDLGIPSPNEKQILLKMRSTSLNQVDLLMVKGSVKESESPLPHALGVDMAGDVVSVGCDVRDEIHTGARIVGMGSGAFADFALVDSADVAIIPDSLDYATASTLPTAGLTAWQIVYGPMKLTQNMRVVVLGAGGAVGSLVVQLLRLEGVTNIIGVCSTADMSYVESLGAAPLDGKKQRIEAFLSEVDVLVDCVGDELLHRCYETIKPDGLVISIVTQPDQDEALKRRYKAMFFSHHPSGRDLQKLVDMAADGRIKVRIDRNLPFREIRQGLMALQDHEARGKIVITISEPTDSSAVVNRRLSASLVPSFC